MGTVANITDLVVARDKAKAAEKIKSTFLQNISHEIRTPLNAIVGSSELLANSYNMLDSKQLTECSSMIESNARSLMFIIDDILVMSNIASGEVEIKRDIVNIEELVVELKGIYNNELVASRKQDMISIDIEKGHGSDYPFMLGDYERIKQVLKHLMNNAVKFTLEGTITLGYDIEGDVITIFVSDTGVGVEPEKMEGIFAVFNQADNSLSRTHGGTGLGLTISKSLVSMMDGVISADSELNKGATFYIELPYLRPDIHN
jgi:signal transduction histidine kinase